MMITENINRIKSELPATVKLVAVSKFHPFESIQEAYDAGQRCFGESRPQELLAKVKCLEELRSETGDPMYMSDLEWHFIGHLQTNKLKMVLPYVSLVQSVDSLRLLKAINQWGSTNGKITDILLECHISSDESKQGFSKDELLDLISSSESYPYVRVRGLMGMASLTDDEAIIREDFQNLLDLNDMLSDWIGESPMLPPSSCCGEISMGMSGDYPIAVSMGATIIRLGSIIFGERI